MTVPFSKSKMAVAKILEREGYIMSVEERADGARRLIALTLKYVEKLPLIRSIKRVSTPGRRVYRQAHELPRVLSDQGTAIISTSAGMMTNREARRRHLGGEVVCEIF